VRRDGCAEELPADDPDALGDHRDQHEDQRDHDDQQRQHHEHGHDAVLGTPPGRRLPQVDRGLVRGLGHQAPPDRRVEPATTDRAMTLMTMVRAKSRTPSPISAARNTPEASPNWSAMTEGIE